jgi:hypothetical protein
MAGALQAFQTLHAESMFKTSEKLQTMTEGQLEGLVSNHAFIGEQMSSLQESTIAVRTKLDAQDIMLSSFLQVVETTAQDILDQSQKQQASVLKLAGEMCSLVKDECSNVLVQAEQATMQVLDAVKSMESSISQNLRKQAEFAKTQRDLEQKALQDEVGEVLVHC